jgi:hypothetical protein
MFAAGDCFTLRSFDKPHLHIVVIEQRPGQNYGQVICVYLSSCENKRESIIDDRTILDIGDHDYITTKSFVRYQNPCVFDKNQLHGLILDSWDPISPEILADIQSAFNSSSPHNRIPNKILKYYDEWYLDAMFNGINKS